MILNGQVPHLTGFTRSVFAPGDEVELHWHKSKDEVFYAAEGKGTIEVDGTVVQVPLPPLGVYDITTLYVMHGHEHPTSLALLCAPTFVYIPREVFQSFSRAVARCVRRKTAQ